MTEEKNHTKHKYFVFIKSRNKNGLVDVTMTSRKSEQSHDYSDCTSKPIKTLLIKNRRKN